MLNFFYNKIFVENNNHIKLNNSLLFFFNVIFLIFLKTFYVFKIFYFFNDADPKHKFDSNMISDDDLFYGFYRLLSVDKNLVLPYNCFIRFLITSLDVLHSWAIPSLGVKMDACPGRVAQIMIYIKREGFFYGQCSEICGINHAFMPIVVEAIDMESYLYWIKNPTPSATYY